MLMSGDLHIHMGEGNMKSKLQIISRAALCAAAPFMMALPSSAQVKTGTQTEDEAYALALTEQLADKTRWQMVWVKNLPMHNLPHPDFADDLDDFIETVNIHTSVIDGKTILTSASANCNFIGRSVRRKIFTPAKTTETIRDGTPHYETVPAVFKTYLSFSTTQKACYLPREIDGKTYRLIWPTQMEEFLISNINTPIKIRGGTILEWADKSGEVIARFEKLPDITTHKNFWRLDPDIHPDDPVLENYFGRATISISFPKLSSNRACSRIFAPVMIKEDTFAITDDVKSYPCEELSVLVDGQRQPYTPVATSAENMLQTYLPRVSKYTVTGEDETRRLVLSDENGNALLSFIPTPRRPSSNPKRTQKIYDRLDNHEWIMQPRAGDRVSASFSPIRIIRHSGYMQDGPKTQAVIVSAKDCALSGLNVNPNNLAMNVYSADSQKIYKTCDRPEALAAKAQWEKAKKLLFDNTHLIFYDENWGEVMRARRGKVIEGTDC